MHHDRPFISGCYIVKNEEEMLGKSLQALAAFVDEIVVYDTGSTDTTREIARNAGVRVVEGYWDDDFGAARNRALEHCRGEWVLNVDADEVVEGDARAWRRSLRSTAANLFAIEVISPTYGEAGTEHRSMVARILRRAQCRWEGILHEQIVGRWKAQDAHRIEGVWIRHYGYQALYMRERNKGARNLALAEAALRKAREHGRADTMKLLINVGRSAALAGDHRKALATFAELDADTLDPGTGVLCGSTVFNCCLAVKDFDTARQWVDRMETWGEGEEPCRALRAQLAMAQDDWAGAEALLLALKDGVHLTSAVFHAESCTDSLITCIARQGRGAEAAELLLSHMATGRSGISPVSSLLLSAEVPDGVHRLADALPAVLEKQFIGQLSICRAQATDEFFDRLWEQGRARTAVMAAVAKQWPTLEFERALDWSLRFREAGLQDLCPLRSIAGATGERDSITRILCASVLVEIGEQDVMPALESMLAVVPAGEIDGLLSKLRTYAPGLAASLVPA